MTEKKHTSAGVEAKLRDALAKADRGEVAHLPFLTPSEQIRVRRALTEAGRQGQAFFFGGYPSSERACLFLLPEYLLQLLDTPAEETSPDTLEPLLGEALSDAVCAVRIRGSGYRELTHRDYLGALLGLGLERDALGDVAVQNSHEAVVFCSRTVARFLSEHLENVASDRVKVFPYRPDESFTDGRRYQPIHDTVASARLDCVVAALTNLSRADAQALIRSGSVDVDFEAEERTDVPLSPPVTLSVRGYGRFLLRSFDGETRKGRLRLFAEKLI